MRVRITNLFNNNNNQTYKKKVVPINKETKFKYNQYKSKNQ